MPADATGWNQNVAVKSTGMHAVKTITRTVNLPNKQVVLTATIERTFGDKCPKKAKKKAKPGIKKKVV